MIPQFQKLKLPLDKKQIDSFNVLLAQLRDLLTRRLTIEENTTSSIVNVRFQAPNTPEFRLATKPAGIVLLALETVEQDNPGSVAMALPFQWSWVSGVASVPSLSALAGTAQYNLRVLVVRG
jgi:hypothetical protein